MSDTPSTSGPDNSAKQSAALRRKSHKRKAAAPPVIRTLKDYVVMVRERWYYGAIVAVIVGGLIIYLEQIKKPYYSTTAKVLIQAPTSATIGPTPNVAGAEPNLAAHIAQIESGKFLDYVVGSFTPSELEKIREPYLDPEKSAAEQISVQAIISNGLEVEESRKAPILSFTVSHRDPEAAQLIANQYSRRYIDFSRDRVVTETSQSMSLLQEEEHRQRERLEESTTALQTYREMHNMPVLNENQSLISQNLQAISREYQEAKRNRLNAEATLNQVEDYEVNRRDLTAISYISSFREVPTLSHELDELRAQRVLLDQKYLENHPLIKANAAAIEVRQGLLTEAIHAAVTELRASYIREKQHEENLLQQQKEAEGKVDQLDKIADGYKVLQTKADIAKSLYTKVVESLNNTTVNSQLSLPNISILEPAWLPTVPDAPNPRKAAMIAGALGILLIIVVPIGLGMMDSRLKAAWEIEQFLDQNLLGEIPSITGLSRAERAHIMAKEHDHGASEAFRGLFGQLQLNSTVAYPKIIMVTSTLPGEGKSVIANNLAATFAAHGKKTLLLDLDFRRPNLHIYYGKDNAHGTLRWLKSERPIPADIEGDVDLAILPVKQDLFLLRAGGDHRRATEIFEMARFHEFLEQLKKEFEVVVADTPPLGIFPDAMLASQHSDEVVFVCRFKTVNRSKIRKTIERLENSKAVVTGVVLNGLPSGNQSAYYDYYGYGSNDPKRYKAYYSQKR